MNERGARGTNEGPASMNKDPGAQEGTNECGGWGEGCRNEHEQVRGERGVYERARGRGECAQGGGGGGTNEHRGSAGGYERRAAAGVMRPLSPSPLPLFLFIISIFLHIFMYAFRIF